VFTMRTARSPRTARAAPVLTPGGRMSARPDTEAMWSTSSLNRPSVCTSTSRFRPLRHRFRHGTPMRHTGHMPTARSRSPRPGRGPLLTH
jgi:hypothetical protein